MASKTGLALGWIGAAAVSAATLGWAAETKRTRPNLLFLMADQFRGDCVGADGNRAIFTPNLDRLAAEGARFRCAYSSMPSCTPARATILTGLSPWHHGMLGYGRVAEKYPRELPQMLRDAGYHAVGIGKMHYHPQRNTHGFHQTILDESGRAESPGFVSDYRQWFKSTAPELDPDATGIGWNDHRAKPYVLPERLHPTQWTGDEAVKFLQQYQGSAPFFLKVSFARPHSPYDPPPRWWERYEKAGLPPAVVGGWAERHAQRGKPYRNDLWQGGLGPEKYRGLWTGATRWDGPETKAALAAFARALAYVNTDHAALSWDAAAQYVADGKAAMTIMGDWAHGYYLSKGLKPDVDYGWAPSPGTAGSYIMLSDSFGLPKGAPDRDAAIKWLTVCASREGQDAFNPKKGSIPSRTDGDRSLYDKYLLSSMDDFKSNQIVPSVAHGAAAAEGWVTEVNDTMTLFVSDRNIDKAAAAFQKSADKYAKK